MAAKAQSQIIQFILFFMIGLALFLTIGGVFRGRLDFFTEDIAEQNRRTINNYFSALTVGALVSCKECDSFNITTKLSNTTAGSFTQVALNSTDLITLTQPGAKQYSGKAHNLIASLVGAGGVGTSNRPIVLSYSKNQNILRVVS